MKDEALCAKWRIIQQEKSVLVVEYDVPNLADPTKILTYKVKIDNFNPGASVELLREAVKGAVRSHYRSHRFVGVSGEVDLATLDTDDDRYDREREEVSDGKK